MKTVCKSLVLIAASVLASGVSQAQDKATLFHERTPATNAATSSSLAIKSEPAVAMGSHTRLSGLFVDLVKPRQTWAMLNPPVSAKELPRPVPPWLMPVKAARPINDPAAHQLDFALLRLSFP